MNAQILWRQAGAHMFIQEILLCRKKCVTYSGPVHFFLARGHAIFQGGHTKYSTLIYKSTLANCRFRLCRVR